MAAVKDLLRAEADGTLSFGDYTLASKTKLDGFEFQGDLYKVKTFKEITKLEKNGMFVYESVPGTAVEHFKMTEDVLSFEVSGAEDAQFTVELEADSKYEVIWQKERRVFFSVKTADMKRTNGLGSAQCAKNGIRLWKSRSLFQSLLLRSR